MNEKGKDGVIGAVAVPLHVAMDRYGNPFGPFATAKEAWDWATVKWGAGAAWDVVALRSPDEA